jgi:hypothetical protein
MLLLLQLLLTLQHQGSYCTQATGAARAQKAARAAAAVDQKVAGVQQRCVQPRGALLALTANNG